MGWAGFHGATGLVHPRNIYIWPVASQGFFLIVAYVTEELVVRNLKNLETWRRMHPRESLFPSGGPSPWVEADRPDLLPPRRLRLFFFLPTSSPSSPVLNTPTHPHPSWHTKPPRRYLATSWTHFPTFSRLFLAGPPGQIHSREPSSPSEK